MAGRLFSFGGVATLWCSIYISPFCSQPWSNAQKVNGSQLKTDRTDSNASRIRSPNAHETNKFIRENLADDFFRVRDLSCTTMQIQADFHDPDDGGKLNKYSFSIPLRDVSFSETRPWAKDSNIVAIKCNSGKCIFHENNLPPFDTQMADAISIGSIIEDTRVIKALNHFQKLCGGVNETAF